MELHFICATGFKQVSMTHRLSAYASFLLNVIIIRKILKSSSKDWDGLIKTSLLSRAIMVPAFMKSASMEKFRGTISSVESLTNQNRLEYKNVTGGVISVHLSVKYATNERIFS